MIDLKNLNGIMDTDSSNQTIGQNSIKMGRNIRFRNGRYENIEGTTLIPCNLPSGVNETIKSFYDDLKQRIFIFLYNSNGTHSIRYIDLNVKPYVVSDLLVCGTNTDGDILGFTLDGKIYDVKILYGDDTQGDTIYFINSQNEPCQINIERTLAGTYGTMTRDFLEVIKYPANRPPYVTYGDDNTVTVNTMRKKLFRFMTRAVYYSREKSVVSIKSELPLPINAADTNIDQDPTKNCKVSIVYETLGADVQYIEILGQVSGKSDENGIIDPNNFSDPFLIQLIDKDALGLNNNDIAIFEFYNNQAYTEIDAEDAIQLFDLVPLEAGALEVLDGKNLIYGAITEGFDLIDIDASATSSSIPAIDTQLPYIFVGSQSGDSAFGTGDIHIVVVGTIAIGYDFTFNTTNETIAYTSVAPTTTDVINGLSAAAVVAGFTVVSSDSQNLVINKTGESLQIVVRESPILAVTNEATYNWNDKIAYCLNYFDKGGRTAGSQTIPELSVQTVNYTETATVPNIPEILISVSNRPPIDAFYFTFGRTKSLAKTKFLYWVSEATYKDSEFAWIRIENLNAFIEKNKPNANHLAYDFAPGDRIRFIKLLSGSVNTVYVNQDFEIYGQELAPEINSVEYTGQFIKIALPATSSTFDFGTSEFYNYKIEIYTPAQSIANSLNKFYEFGERFTIGNPGTATRYHQGMIQNQTPNLSQPATFTFNKGPNYYRNRDIDVGVEYKWIIPNYEQSIPRTTMAWYFISQTYNDPNILAGDSINASILGFDIATNTDRAILNVISGTYNFRIKGSIKVTFNDTAQIFSFYLMDSQLNKTVLVPAQGMPRGSNVFGFDTTFQMTPNTRMFIFAYAQDEWTNSKQYTETDITITRELTYVVPVMDENYSDYFASAVNSDGRPLIEQPESARAFNGQLLRWSRANQKNTNINEVNKFTVLNFDEVDGRRGDIKLLNADDRRILDVLQERGCSWYGVYSKILQSNQGADVITTTDEIITKNNVQYLAGSFGIGNNKGSFAKTKLGYFFTDSVRGYQVRRSQDGLTPINEIFLGQYFIRNILTNYNNDYIRPNGSIAIIVSYYDYFEEQYSSFCQSGVYDGKSIPNQNFSFNENNKGYCSFYDFNPEWIICAQDKTFSWKNGQSYIHNNKTDYCKFYEEQTYPSITLVFNGKVVLRKTDKAISYQSDYVWESPTNGDIKTSEFNEDTGLQQISALITRDYKQRGNYWDAGLLRDANSMSDAREALLEGDFLSGTWIEVKLTYFGNKFVSLFSPYLNDENLPRNL